MALNVILERTNPNFPAYLAKDTESGKFFAGTTMESAKEFESAQAVWDYYYPLSKGPSMTRRYTAWNICYFAEDHIEHAS